MLPSRQRTGKLVATLPQGREKFVHAGNVIPDAGAVVETVVGGGYRLGMQRDG